jgi:hypothetical protein
MIQTACGLDCPDACGITADAAHLPRLAANTNTGALCSLLNKEFFNTPRIEKPRIDGREVSMGRHWMLCPGRWKKSHCSGEDRAISV